MFDLGMQELIVIFIVALIVFGPKRLPELGRSLGRGLSELKKAMEGVKGQIDEEMRDVKGTVDQELKPIREPIIDPKDLLTLKDQPAPKAPDRGHQGPGTQEDRPRNG